jgi:hypothetical protein
MSALELFAILVLAGAVIVLIYYYLLDIGFSFNRIRSNNNGSKTMGITESVSGLGDKIKETGTKVKQTSVKTTKTEGGSMAGMSERMAGMSERIKGKVKEVPISTDLLSNRIETFLDEQSDQLIKNWDLATKKDLSQLEKRFDKVSLDFGELEKRFNEYRGYTNKKLDHIDKRLKKLENPEEESKE